VPLVVFLVSRLGSKTGIYYIDSTALAIIIASTGIRRSGPTGQDGLVLRLQAAPRLQQLPWDRRPEADPCPWHHAGPSADLIGKLFGDKGYIGQKLAEDLLRLTLFTRVRRNMKSLPLSLQDKALLKARNMADIGHIKEFSSLNLSRHRSVINAFVHIIAAITAYQINPFKPKLNLQPRYQLETTAWKTPYPGYIANNE
jgi:hypothetical protein